jgi:cytochrome c oxidase assembly protein subunit 11
MGRMSSESKHRAGKRSLTAALCGTLVVGMVGLAFAAVPLYRLFCEVTGYGGTPQRADGGSDRMLDREIVVRFDANVAGLAWNFRPAQAEIRVQLGETVLVNYIAESAAPTATTGTATFNVLPETAGYYFNKIECFCFRKQELQPGERMEMPVQFFVSADLADDRELDSTRTITLSYTFFPAAEAGQPVAQTPGDEEGESM